MPYYFFPLTICSVIVSAAIILDKNSYPVPFHFIIRGYLLSDINQIMPTDA